MRHFAVMLALVIVLLPLPAVGRHVPPVLAFIHNLERVRVDNTCRDPLTKEPAVCEVLVDRLTSAHYRVIYRELEFSSLWRLEHGTLESGTWVIIWPRNPDCKVELCT